MNNKIINGYAEAVESGYLPALAFLEKNKKAIDQDGPDCYLDFVMNTKIRYIENCQNELENILSFVKQLKNRSKYFVSHSAMVYNFLTKCQFNISKEDLLELQQFLRDRPNRFTFMYFMSFLSSNVSEQQTDQLFRIMDRLLNSILANIKQNEKAHFDAYFYAFRNKQFSGNRAFDTVMLSLSEKYSLGLAAQNRTEN